MKLYKGITYPDLNDVINSYSVPSLFSKDEKECPNLFVRFPSNSQLNGLTLSVEVDRAKIFEYVNRGESLPKDLAKDAEEKIDKVCQNYIDNFKDGNIF